MASLVNSVGNTCQSGEISRNISQVRYRYGEIFAKIVNVESNLRNVGTYYVNSAQILRASVNKNLENL